MDVEIEPELDLMQQAELEAEAEEEAENIEQIARDPDDEDPAEEVEENDEAPKIVKPKKIVRNPQPKLNAETLRGPRGLTALPALFAKQKFAGKGHEEDDLNVLLKTYEYWCHRLFPKLQFDQCIDKIESLGAKKPVMTYIKKIRSGLVDDELEEARIRQEADEREENEEIEVFAPHIESVESRFDEIARSSRQDEPEVVLTEEQLERIRVNKERAIKLRLDRLKAIQAKAAAQIQSNETSQEQNNESGQSENQEMALSMSNSANNQSNGQNEITLESQDCFSDSVIDGNTQNREDKRTETAQHDDDDDIERMLEQEDDLRTQIADESEMNVDDYLNSLQN